MRLCCVGDGQGCLLRISLDIAVVTDVELGDGNLHVFLLHDGFSLAVWVFE